jgi:hypothetical protein
MYVATEQLKMLWLLRRDRRASCQIRAEITAVSQWIAFLSQQREHVIETGNQRPDVVRLGARIVCDACRNDAGDNRDQTSPQNGLAQLPIWTKQLEFLLASTKRVGSELFVHACASYSLERFPECLTKLVNALLKQRQTGAAETRSAVEHRSDTCGKCGKAMESSAPTMS